MTLQEIVTQALHKMGRATDGQALLKYTPEFLFTVNEGVKEIAQRYHQSRKDTVALTGGTFDKSLLSHRVYAIKDVQVSGASVSFYESFAGSGVYVVDTDAASADVIYRFVPVDLTNSIDEPEIPEEYHGMLVNYVVGNKMLSNDASMLDLAASQINLFQSKLRSITPCDIPTALTGYYT